MGFKPGACIVYRAYGAGTIMSEEDRVFAGTVTRYYIISMVADEGEFMVPVAQAEALGIRPVVDSKVILGVLQSQVQMLSGDYKERQAVVSVLLSSGDADQMSQAARNLAWFAGWKSLTGRDIQLYEELQTRLAGELSLAQGIDLEEARQQLGQELAAITEKAEREAQLERERVEREAQLELERAERQTQLEQAAQQAQLETEPDKKE